MKLKILLLTLLLTLSSCGEVEPKSNWTDEELNSINKAFKMPDNGDKNLYSIPFMFIDNTYSLLTIDELNMVNYLVVKSSEDNVKPYYDLALSNGFEILDQYNQNKIYKIVPTGKIELEISYGLTPYTSSMAFLASAKMIIN